jgi:hypothetical protein
MLLRFDVHRLPFALTARNPATSRTSTILRGHLVSSHGSGLDVRMGFEDRACETQLAKAAWLLEQAVFQSSLAELQTEKDSMAERRDSNHRYRLLDVVKCLLTVYEVAREFEFTSLRQRIISFRDSLPLCLKNAHLALCRDYRGTSSARALAWAMSASSRVFSALRIEVSFRWFHQILMPKYDSPATPSTTMMPNTNAHNSNRPILASNVSLSDEFR